MEKISKEEAKKIMEIEGKVKGEVFLTDMGFIKEKKKEKGLEDISKEMARIGYPVNYREIKRSDWYPIGLRILSLLVTKQIFNWGDEEIKEMAQSGPRMSFIIRIFMVYFMSKEKIFKTAFPKLWPKFFSRGVTETVEFSEDKKSGRWIVRIKDFPSHPLYCYYLGNYFIGIAKLIARFKEVTTKETKCPSRGDPYHEFLLEWKN